MMATRREQFTVSGKSGQTGGADLCHASICGLRRWRSTQARVPVLRKTPALGVPPLAIFVSVHSKGNEVLCFDTISQVFILNGLAGRIDVSQKIPVSLIDGIQQGGLLR
jgi:hypothetical protein